jgi:tetratricopeptide (TPR) repeat protein
MFRLAQALQADANGNYGPAISAYEQLISEYPKSPYASRSYVPLAVCYMASDRRTEAEQQLLAVLKGERFLKPDAADYREAQLALGRLYYDSGEHLAALEHLDAAVRRYPDDPRIRQTLFLLADAYRNFAAALKETIDQPTTPRAEREQMVEQRRQHLEHAGGLFDQVIERYETIPEALLDNLQRDQVRLAHLYRSDAAFELAQFDKAIELYDYAARKYSTHHSSMVALVQIVNCYHLLGDAERARTAHARALVRLGQLPPEAFDAPDAIMNRAAWEDWLRNSPLGQARVASAEGT